MWTNFSAASDRQPATKGDGMARTWLSVRVELVEGRGGRLWPRPGRILAAARSHSFAALATAIRIC